MEDGEDFDHFNSSQLGKSPLGPSFSRGELIRAIRSLY
jgi:hypothetical protein